MIVNEMIDRNVLVRTRAHTLTQPWLTRDLKSLRNKRNKAYQKFKRSELERDHQQFIWLSMLFHQLNDSAYKDYVVNLGQKLKADPKCFWKFVSDKRQAKGLPLSVEFKGQHSTSDQERCDFFAEYMQSVYSPPLTFDETDFEYLQDMPKFLNTDIELTNELVYESLLKLDTGKGPGPDGLPPLFLRNVAGQVCNPLFKLFEISFKTGYFPRIWKKSFLTPNHKREQKWRTIEVLQFYP